jgi:hypothetical protein
MGAFLLDGRLRTGSIERHDCSQSRLELPTGLGVLAVHVRRVGARFPSFPLRNTSRRRCTPTRLSIRSRTDVGAISST